MIELRNELGELTAVIYEDSNPKNIDSKRIDALISQIEFLEDCIVEMATQVYS